MAVVRPWRQRRRKKWMNGIVAFNRKASQILVDAMQADLDRYAAKHDVRTIAQKVIDGDAHVLGLNEARDAVVVAERKREHVTEDELWNRVARDIDRAQHALRMQFACDEAPVFGVTPATTVRTPRAGCAEDPSDRATGERAMPDDVLPEGARWVRGPAMEQPELAPLHDDGGVPAPSEIAAVMNAGVCDNPDLVGTTVLYETDGRSMKRYAVPAIVTCVQRTHTLLPSWRAAQEQGARSDGTGIILPGIAGEKEWAALGIHGDQQGIFVGSNPLPIPHDGTAHLYVFSPGEPYRELSVPFDPSGSPRSFRFHPNSAPF